MFIKSSKYDLKFNIKPEELVNKESIVNEEVKLLNNEIVQRPKKKKNIPTPVIEEPIIEVVEEKTEDEDLSKWLEEHTED
jgi:hypothetical protein